MNTSRGDHFGNISFDGRPVHILISSNRLILVDPLALDGLSEQLAGISPLSESEQIAQLHELGNYGLRIGLHRLKSHGPATYEVGLDKFEPAGDTSHPGIFDIDSGTVVLIDAAALHLVARALSWDRYDQLCRIDGGNIAAELNREIGGPHFAVISGDARTPFAGDGSYQLGADALRAVT